MLEEHLFVKVTKCEPEEDACGGAAAVEEGGGDDSVDEVGTLVEELELATTALEVGGAESTTVKEEVAGATEPKSEEGTAMDSEALVLVVPPTDSESADATTVVELEVEGVKLHEARLRFTVRCSTSLSTIWEACFATSW